MITEFLEVIVGALLGLITTYGIAVILGIITRIFYEGLKNGWRLVD